MLERNFLYFLENGEVYVWGFGILGKGPNLEQCQEPQLIPMTLFGLNPFSADIKVDKVYAGVNFFGAVTS